MTDEDERQMTNALLSMGFHRDDVRFALRVEAAEAERDALQERLEESEADRMRLAALANAAEDDRFRVQDERDQALSEVRSLRGVVQAVADLAAIYERTAEVDPSGEFRKRAVDIRAALAAAADAPQPTDDAAYFFDDGGFRAAEPHVTETFRQTISGREQLGWECATCGRHQFVVAGPGMGNEVPAADMALLERLAAEHVREASAGPSPAVLPQPPKDQR